MASSKSVFVAMPYETQLKLTSNEPGISKYIYERLFTDIIKPVIEKAGFRAVRADFSGRQSRTEGIMDEIWQAHFVLADLAELNFNVAYELGVAHVLHRKTAVIFPKNRQLPSDVNMLTCFSYSREPVCVETATKCAFNHKNGKNIRHMCEDCSHRCEASSKWISLLAEYQDAVERALTTAGSDDSKCSTFVESCDIPSVTKCFGTQRDLYEDLIETLDQKLAHEQNPIRIKHMGVHPRGKPTKEECECVQRLFAAYEECVRAATHRGWGFYDVFNIFSDERLNIVQSKVAQLAATGNRRYHAKAFVSEVAAASICPFIIGDRDVFLAISDGSGTSVSLGLHLVGSTAVRIFDDYYDKVFQSSETIPLAENGNIRTYANYKEFRAKAKRHSKNHES